ncbi:MAG: 4Fe-4S dicluster domain-containing protein [Desulfobulbales bacterium]
MQVKGCLAGLGASVYLALLLLDVERVILRAEACADCPVGQLGAEVHAWAARADRLLAPWGFSDRLTLLTALPGEPLYARPSWSASDPPLSRRDLFRLASRQGQIAAARAVLKDINEAHKLPGRERRRLLAVLPRMPETQHTQTCQPEDGFGWIELEGSCTACGVCARACPTGALSFLDEDDTYTLGFDPRLCIGCAACTHVCAPDALRLDQTPDLQQVFAVSDALVLQSGEFRRCKRCKARFAAVSDEALCPVCTFRSKNPFGTALPPALLGRSKSGERL